MDFIVNGANGDASKWLLTFRLACSKGNLDHIKKLLQPTVVPKKFNQGTGAVQAMVEACIGDNVEAVKLLFKTFSCYTPGNAKKVCCNEALWLACDQGNVEIVKTLLDQGSTSKDICEYGGKALDIACDKNHTEVVKLLLNLQNFDAKSGVKFQKLTEYQIRGVSDTPIHSACSNGNLEILKLLISNEPSLQDYIQKGKYITLLHDACWHDHKHIIRYLLDQGITAEEIRKHTSIFKLAIHLEYFEILRMLIDHADK
jgi:hypothetical protein